MNNALFSLLSQHLIIGCLLLSVISCGSNDSKFDRNESSASIEAMEDWENKKFSMFIHWGIYSIPAGVWEGQKISGYSEQIKGHAKIPTEKYRALAHQFTPTHWNADSVAVLAKRAGMKSIVITAKHHDGFCMFDSKFTAFDVVDATPYKKDILKELSAACAHQNLKFGVYFSLIDWDYKGAMPFVSVRNSDSIPPKHHHYNLKQIEELLTNYGQVSEIWFDMGAPTPKQSEEIATLVKKIQPNCLVSGRIWNDQGDFVVMGDNHKPDFKMGVPWQTPASMFPETWSYRSWQERPSVEEKTKEKIHDLINVVSLGGNYLLNIGPKADGAIVPFEKQVLKKMGKWLKENGEAIYATTTAPIDAQEWGFITAKDGKLYFLITNFPENNKLTIKGLNANIISAIELSDSKKMLQNTTNHKGLEIDLTNIEIRDKYATVIVVEYEGELLYTPKNVIYPDEENTYTLTWDNATKLHSFSGHDYYSTQPTIVKVKWYLSGNKIESYQFNFAYSNGMKQPLNLSINNHSYIISGSAAENGHNNSVIEQVNLHLNNNEIELSLEDKSNPHKGFYVENLKIKILEFKNK